MLEYSQRTKILWNIKVTVLPIVVGTFGTVFTSLEKRLEDLEARERIGTN